MFDIFKKLVALVCVVMTAGAAAYAQSGNWRVVETSGVARTSQPMSGVQLISTGETLGAGAVISTGMSGRVVLSRGDQQIVVGPSSRMSLPAAEEPGMTKILQDLGTLMFKVDKREKQHFRVETPIIAAVVKGTTFTVTAGADAHVVHVAEGAVEVSSMNGSASQLVTPGVTAYISRNEPNVIRVGAPQGEGFEGSNGQSSGRGDLKKAELGGEGPALKVPAEIGAGPADYAELSNGLINAGDRAQPATQASFGQARADAVRENNANRVAAVRQAATNNAGGNGRAPGVGGADGNPGGNGLALGVGGGNGNAGGNGNGLALGVGGGNGNAGGNGNGLALGVGGGNGNAGVNVNAGAGNGGVNVNAGVSNGNGNNSVPLLPQ